MVSNHHNILIVFVALEARYAGRFSSALSILPKLRRQCCYYSTPSTLSSVAEYWRDILRTKIRDSMRSIGTPCYVRASRFQNFSALALALFSDSEIG